MRIRYVGLVAAVVLSANVRAQACSCKADRAMGVWPRDGAVGAAVDTPVVVAASDLEYLTPSLVAEDGTVVELREQRRLVPPGAPSCVKNSYAFLAATEELAPNTRYSLIAHFDNGSASEVNPRTGVVTFDRTTSFVTGTERRDPAPPEVRLNLFAGYGRQGTNMLLDVYVETTAVEPLFVVAHGERDVLVHDLDPLRTEQPFRVSFGFVECAALTVADVTGAVVEDRTLREPSKCALIDSFGASDCGDENFPSVNWSTWQTLPEGCDLEVLRQSAEERPMETPAALPVDVTSGTDLPGLQSDDVASEATTLSPPAEVSTARQSPQSLGGCGLSLQKTHGSSVAVFSFLLAALARSRPRRRSTR